MYCSLPVWFSFRSHVFIPSPCTKNPSLIFFLLVSFGLYIAFVLIQLALFHTIIYTPSSMFKTYAVIYTIYMHFFPFFLFSFCMCIYWCPWRARVHIYPRALNNIFLCFYYYIFFLGYIIFFSLVFDELSTILHTLNVCDKRNCL